MPFMSLPNLHRVYLGQLPLLASANPKLWLIGLIVAENDDIAHIVRKIQDHGQNQAADGIDWQDLLETVLVYKLTTLTREEIQQMLNFTDVSLKQTRFYQDVFAEGLVEGKAEGKAEGRVEGEATLLLRLLERKFPPLPESARRHPWTRRVNFDATVAKLHQAMA